MFPFPARGLKLIARSGTVCSITMEATNEQSPYSSSFTPPSPRASGSKARGQGKGLLLLGLLLSNYFFLFAPNAPAVVPSVKLALNSPSTRSERTSGDHGTCCTRIVIMIGRRGAVEGSVSTYRRRPCCHPWPCREYIRVVAAGSRFAGSPSFALPPLKSASQA